MTHRTKIYCLIAVILASLNSISLYEVLVLHNTALCNEGGFVENVAAGSFLFSGLILIFQSLGLTSFEKKLTQTFGLICILCFFREVDVEDLNSTRAIQWIGYRGRDVLFSFLLLYLIVSAFLCRPTRLPELIKGLFRSEITRLCLTGTAFLIMAEGFEHLDMMITEEILELNGSIIILCAALIRDHSPIWSGLPK